MDEKLKSENMQKKSTFRNGGGVEVIRVIMFVIFSEQSGQAGVERRYADHI